MLSIGIRFGEGFDKNTVLKFTQRGKMDYEFDFIVIGTNPGGLALAKEASEAGKKVAVINWKSLIPAEEGYKAEETNKPVKKGGTKWSKKVRQNKIDVLSRITDLGLNARKLMRNAALLYEAVNDAKNSYWSIEDTNLLSINWMEMTDHIIDYVMSENWKIRNDLSNNTIEVIEGVPIFKDEHSVIVSEKEGGEREVQAEGICIALEGQYQIPEDIPGAVEYGVTCDDLIRFEDPPGRTLIVGSGPAALECAGIISGLRFAVTVVCPSTILKGYDRGMSQLIMDDMPERGVTFAENSTLKWIRKNKAETRLLTRITFESSDGGNESGDAKKETFVEEEYDTVLFATDAVTPTENLNLNATGIKIDVLSNRIFTNNEQTEVGHIYAIGDIVANHPKNNAVTELAGRLLGRRLFYSEETQLDCGVIPHVIFTPTEYAFIGLSEAGALLRFGQEYIDVYYESFKPLEHIIPPKNAHCHVKVIVLKPIEQVIGLHFFGPDAAEIIQGFSSAMRCGLSLKSLQTSIGVPTTKAREILNVRNKKFLEADELENGLEMDFE